MLIGIGLITLWIVVVFAGPQFALHDPMARNAIIRDPNGSWLTPPFPPFVVADYPLGVDLAGRDVLSRLLWAVRPTFFLAMITGFTRLLLGTALGILEGWYSGRWLGDAINTMTSFAASVPVLLAAILVIGLLGIYAPSWWYFVIGLSVTGWAATAQLVAKQVLGMRKEQYIESARALGAGDLQILVRHVLPQIRLLLPMILAFELSATLLQMAELGFLGVFLGRAEAFDVPVGNLPGFRIQPIPGQPELAQMLSAGWESILLTPWIAILSGTTFFLIIFSFMVLGEGLRYRYESFLKSE